MFAAAGCVGFNKPEGWAGPTVAGDLLVVSTDKGELSALDPNPESGAQCDNSTDDDEDGWVNEGCPKAGDKDESGKDCDNDTSDDTVDDTPDDTPDDDKVNDGCPPFVPLWTFPTGDEEPKIDLEAIYGTPLVSGGTVYFAAYSGDVYALSLETGEPLWNQPFDTDSAIIAGIALAETALYVADDDGRLHVLDPQTGRRTDVFDAGEIIWAAPLLAEGVLYVASVNGRLYALDAETFEPVWDAPFETGHGLISDPVLADGTVLVGGIDRELHAVDAETGDERWSFGADNWFWGRPLVEDGTVYAPSLDGRLYALSFESGEERWSFEADNWFWTRPLVADGTVYAPNLDGRLYALSLENGEERWSFEAEDPDPLRSAPVLAGEALVIVDRGGNVFGLDPEEEPEDERLRWSEALEKTVLSNPLVVGEEVLISAQGGDLFSVDPVTGRSSEVETP